MNGTNERGLTLIELMIAALVGSIVLLAVGSLFVAMIRFASHANAQVLLQRQGTFILDGMARQIHPSTGLPFGTCGPVGATTSLRIAYSDGPFRCLYQQGNAILECQFTSLNTTCAPNTTQNLLLGSLIPIQAHNLTFTSNGTSVAVSFILTEVTQASSAVIQSCFFVVPLVCPTPPNLSLVPMLFATRVTIRN